MDSMIVATVMFLLVVIVIFITLLYCYREFERLERSGGNVIAFSDIKSACFALRDGILITLEVIIDPDFSLASIKAAKSLDYGQYFEMFSFAIKGKKLLILDTCSYRHAHIAYQLVAQDNCGTSATVPVHIDLQQDLQHSPPGTDFLIEIDWSLPLSKRRILRDPVYIKPRLNYTPIGAQKSTPTRKRTKRRRR